MKDIRSIHAKAMDLMRSANEFLSNRDQKSYLANLKEALSLEEEAANELIINYQSEPTRSVLFRSAANIAYNLGEYNRAEKLIYQALSGSPHSEIKAELLNLKDLIDTAFVRELSANDIADYSYVNVIKQNAVNLKIEPKSDRYSKAVVVDYIVDFLKNIQASYKNFAEVQFRKNFTEGDYPNYDGALTLFRKDSSLLMVDLNFQSFGVGLVADGQIMNYQYDISNKFTIFKKTIFDRFKQDVLFADFNSDQFHEEVASKYDESERAKIYSTIVSSLESRSDYKISICDENFRSKVRDLPTVTKKTLSFLKPKLAKADDSEKELLIKRTMELTDADGLKKTKLQTEFLSYAEFQISISTIKNKEADLHIFFSDPYTIKVIFSDNKFSVADSFFDIYVENQDFKEIQKSYEITLANKYLNLTSGVNLTVDENEVLENMKSTFLTT
jgi:tetratricopeptide (TPR) repeat protein